MVVFFHLADFADTPLLNNDFVRNSDMFVDFFFVLSGFVIAYNYQTFAKTEEIGTFLQKRLYRIYPLHLLMLLAFFVYRIGQRLSFIVRAGQSARGRKQQCIFVFYVFVFTQFG
jgi:peptidoglycan/LPS O-acetylase OafA/YrhL